MKTFKKTLVKSVVASALLALSSSALADSFIQGSIVEVKDAEKSVVIDSVYQGLITVKILPTTRIELDDCGPFGSDWFENGNFKDLKVGRYLEVDSFHPTAGANPYNQNPQNPQATTPTAPIVATKVEVKCYKRAY